jgi:hypothetical protein
MGGGSPEQILAGIDRMSQTQGYMNTLLSREPAWSGYMPSIDSFAALTDVMPIAGLRTLAEQYGPLVFQLFPHELKMIQTLIGGQSTDEQGNPLWRQNERGEYINAAGQVIPQFVTDESGQQVINPDLQAVTLNPVDRDAAVGEVLNAAAGRMEAAANRESALGTLGGQADMLRDFYQSIENDPVRQQILNDLIARSGIGGGEPYQVISDELVQRNFDQVERLIMREFGQEMTVIGARLGEAGLGASSQFLTSLRDQIRARSVEARQAGLTELQTWQGNTNAQYQAIYTEQLTRFEDRHKALQATLHGLMLGVSDQIASVQLGNTSIPVDLAPLAEMMSSFNQLVADTQRMFGAENPDILTIILETLSGLVSTYLPIWGSGAIQNL